MAATRSSSNKRKQPPSGDTPILQASVRNVRQRALDREAQLAPVIHALQTTPHHARNVPKTLKTQEKSGGAPPDVHRTTIWRRLRGLTQCALFAHSNQMLLTHMQEFVLVEWIKLKGYQGEPYDRMAIRVEAKRIGNLEHLPSADWVTAFEGRHPDVLLKPPRGLDPKRCQEGLRFQCRSLQDKIIIIIINQT
jgi:hypothetical protein